MSDEQLDRQLASLRIVVTALAVGTVVIAGGLVFTATRMNNAMLPDPIIAYAMLGFGVLAVLLNLTIVPSLVASVHRPMPGVEPVQAFAGRTLVLAGLIEGPAVLLSIMFLITSNWLVLTPVPPLLLLLLMQRPTRDIYDQWLQMHGEARE